MLGKIAGLLGRQANRLHYLVTGKCLRGYHKVVYCKEDYKEIQYYTPLAKFQKEDGSNETLPPPPVFHYYLKTLTTRLCSVCHKELDRDEI